MPYMSDPKDRLSIELLCRVGETLYGDQWKTYLARALDVTPRSMRRFAVGDLLIPRRFPAELIEIIEQRRADLRSLARELAKLVPPE